MLLASVSQHVGGGMCDMREEEEGRSWLRAARWR